MNRNHTPLVDLHSHVLPGMDDGARDDETALAMLRTARADGIIAIAATPHAHHTDPATIPGHVDRLNELASGAGIDISIIPGSEVRIDHNLVERYRDGRIVTLNRTNYLLMELFLSHELSRHTVETVVDDLLSAGLLPILAHAERYAAIQRDPTSVIGLISRGVPIQINAGSLTGYHGGDARVAAEALLHHRLAHLIASDAHNAGNRAPAIRTALDRASELTDPDYAEWMAATAATIVRGESVPLPEPVRSR